MESIAETLLNDILAPSEIESIEESNGANKKNVERKTQSVHEKEENEENASDAGGTQVRYNYCLVVMLLCLIFDLVVLRLH